MDGAYMCSILAPSTSSGTPCCRTRTRACCGVSLGAEKPLQNRGTEMSTAIQQAVLFEIDEKSWDTHLDRVERWFHHMQTVQTAFRKLVEDTLPKMHDSHLREYLTEILERAKDHESKTDDLLRMIGRDPSASRNALGTGFAKAQELVADLKGFAGGAMSGWRDLQQLVHASLDGIAVFGVAQDLGL